MSLRLTSTTVGLAVGVTVAVSVAFGGGAYLFSVHHYDTLLESARATALSQAELIREALEHQMIENDRTLIAQMVESFGRQPRVTSVVLLDRAGQARFASGPRSRTIDLDLGSPTCQACHRSPPAERGSSRVIEVEGGTLLRTVVPFRNRPACHGCHPASHQINGILLLDVDVGEMHQALNSDLRNMLGGSAALALTLVLAIALVLRVVVLDRLQHFESTARQVAAGDLSRRVPAEGTDTLAWLARAFNTMADSMTNLLAEVQSQRERLETVMNSIDDGIVVLDPKRQVIAANRAFLARTGRTRDQALGCCCTDLGPDLCSVGDCPTMACLTQGQHQIRICERRQADGQVAWEEVHASPVRGADGSLLQVVEVWRDISERRMAEARLAESHRLASLGVLASGFSHELNTPLATVLTCVEGILRQAQTGSDAGINPAMAGPGEDWAAVVERADIARQQVLRCRDIIQRFRRLARGQASTADIVEVGAAVAAAARTVEPTAHERLVVVILDPVPDGLRVRADEAELGHALVNLLLNAVQACRPGGQVRVSVSGGETLRIRVADDGCGITAAQREHLFEPFFSGRTGGTGLGLFLSLNFVRRAHGDIVVTSTPGRGSVFEVQLPPLVGATAGSAAP
ncbi:MAG: ATP-binding protein [Vicinamibacteria bacterium]|nr:ATP-binding protein [Vicinamibacteria bacterium]